MAEQSYQDVLLKRLDEYNETFLDTDYKDNKTRKSKKSKNHSGVTDNDTSIKSNRRQKKKERKRKQKELAQVEIKPEKTKNSESLCKFSGEKRTLFELKNELGLGDFQKKLELENKQKESESRLLNKKEGPEVVVYENPSKRKRKMTPVGDKKMKKNSSEDDDEEFNMKRARYEVRKFGIKGFKGDKKDEAMVALLVQLGAKAPKNKYYNYKEFIKMKKDEKETQKKQKEIDRSLGYKVASNAGRKREKDRNDIGGHVDGQVGKFKNGVQFVKKTDLKGFQKRSK